MTDLDQRVAVLEERHQHTQGHVKRLISELGALREEVAGLRADLRALTATYEAERRGLRVLGAVVLAAAGLVGWAVSLVVQLWRQ